MAACLWAGPEVQAQRPSVHASVSHQQIPQGGRLELRVMVEGTQQVDAPQLSFEGFETRYLGPSTQISIVNGQMASSITHVYLLTAQKEGVSIYACARPACRRHGALRYGRLYTPYPLRLTLYALC